MEEIGAICMAISENDQNNIFVGTDESDIYQIYTNQSSNENPDNISEVFRKHNAPITGLDLHPGDVHKNASV
jgi:predicted secreted protein